MDGAIRRVLRCLGVTATGLAMVIALLATAGTAAATQAQYDKAYRIGLEAYTYGLPLLQTNVTFRTMTSIDVSQARLRAGQPVPQRAQAERPEQYGRRRPGRQLALVHRVGRPQAGAAGAVRASGADPRLRPRPRRSVHDQHPEPGQRAPHPAGLVRALRARPAPSADPAGRPPPQRPLLPAVDHRLDPAARRVGPQERPPDPGPLRADAAQPVRHRLPPQDAGAPAHQSDDVPPAARPAVLRCARQATRVVPADRSRRERAAPVRDGRHRPRSARDRQQEPQPRYGPGARGGRGRGAAADQERPRVAVPGRLREAQRLPGRRVRPLRHRLPAARRDRHHRPRRHARPTRRSSPSASPTAAALRSAGRAPM